MKKIYFITAITLLIFNSCKKEIKTELPSKTSISEKQSSKVLFSKVLAIAIEKEPTLRSFIKTEALKQFDNDNDVLFQMVKDVKLENNLSIYETIAKYSSSRNDFDNAIEDLPTLTIFVPEVPNFSAYSWDVINEIPLVAVSPMADEKEGIFLYNSKGVGEKMPFGAIPGVPIIVVKENKKIIENAKTNSRIIVNNSNVKLYFADKAFDGIITNQHKNKSITTQSKSNGKISRIVDLPLNLTPGAVLNGNTIDKASIDAFDLNLDWHRDFIYYGLNPASGIDKGKFNNDYVEHIVAIKFADNTYQKIRDHSSDPKAISYWVRQRPRVNWTDGNYDIRIAILINAKNGGGTQLEKIFSIKPSDLFDLEYTHRGNTIYYDVTNVIPKTYYLNEPIVAWDLENYGSQWKFIVREFDPTTETILTYTNSTQFATNFGFDASFGEKVKLGIKFGATITETSSNTFQVKTTTGSNDLGEGILEFANPIILRKETYLFTPPPPRLGAPTTPPYYKERYLTNDVTTGSVFISVEPKRIRNF